jgi:hypothetical protein
VRTSFQRCFNLAERAKTNKPPNRSGVYLRVLFLVYQFERARNLALRIVRVQNVCFCSFCEDLLKFPKRFFRFGRFSFFHQVGERAGQVLHVNLHTKVLGSTLVVLAKIFDGSLLNWHRKMSRRIPKFSESVNIWYTLPRLSVLFEEGPWSRRRSVEGGVGKKTIFNIVRHMRCGGRDDHEEGRF